MNHMADSESEKLRGDKLYCFFNQLIVGKAIISMCALGTDFERLTCVNGVQKDSDTTHLIIDLPDGFRETVRKLNEWLLRFSFIGPDRLEYIFNTRGGTFEGKALKLPIPDCVERLQRRRNFRVAALPKSKLLFVHNNLKGVILLINVSVGGAFGVLAKHNQKNTKRILLTAGEVVENIGIRFPAQNGMDEQVVIIKKAVVRRIEHDKEKDQYKFAFEYTEIDRFQHQKLTRIIYDIQRYYLKNR
jgi:c-di-GMP-binding flagellar brake protein YcgR